MGSYDIATNMVDFLLLSCKLFSTIEHFQAGDADIIEHPASLTDIVMFSFKKNSGKQKVRIYCNLYKD